MSYVQATPTRILTWFWILLPIMIAIVVVVSIRVARMNSPGEVISGDVNNGQQNVLVNVSTGPFVATGDCV
jgi:hypothetical protein